MTMVLLSKETHNKLNSLVKVAKKKYPSLRIRQDLLIARGLEELERGGLLLE